MADRYAIRVIRVPETGGGVDDGVVFCDGDDIAAFRDLVVNGSPPGPAGAAGASAYAVAVAGGFVGDAAAWLASLVGAAGADSTVPGPKGDKGDAGTADYEDLTNVPTTFAPTAHKTSHQDGGADEISVQGLSGVLTDPQPPIIGATGTTAVAGDDSRLTNSRAPSGSAGGVLSGSYPNPGFAADMATQAELDAAVAAGPLNAYPVGSIYMSTVSTSPATLFGGGTWAAIENMFLVGAKADDADFAPGNTGGARTVTLSATEMPSHTHVQDAHGHGVTDGGHSHTTQRYPTATGGSSGFTIDTSMSGTLADNTLATKSATTGVTVNNATATNQSTGGDGAHQNLPPYLAVYAWQRTA